MKRATSGTTLAVLAIFLGACGQPDTSSGFWAATAPLIDADATDDSFDGSGSDATMSDDARIDDARIDDALLGDASSDASVDLDAGSDAGSDASVDLDAGFDAGSDAGSDAGYPIDAPILVDAGPTYDAPPDGPICTPDGCSTCSQEGCPCAPLDPIREMIDLNVIALDIAPGGYAFLSVTAQMSDGNFVPLHDNHWSSSDPMVAFVYPTGYVYVAPLASPGATTRITVTTPDGLHSASLLLTVKQPSPIAHQGSNTPT